MEEDADDEGPVPTPRPKPTRKSKAPSIPDEDMEMEDVAIVSSKKGKGKARGKKSAARAESDDPMTSGAKRILQESPSRVEPIAKRLRTGTAQLLDLGDVEVDEETAVDLELVPTLVDKVRKRLPIAIVSGD